MKEDGVIVDSNTFKFLLDAFIRSSKFDTTIDVLDYMKKKLGACLNASIYDSVLVALVRKSQVDLALSIFCKLLEAYNGNDNGDFVVYSLPYSIAINELLVALRKVDIRA
ncbi:hypothetical protein V6N13_064103 [Hibiscus sabdariffa]